jgi:hypothetical protein
LYTITWRKRATPIAAAPITVPGCPPLYAWQRSAPSVRIVWTASVSAGEVWASPVWGLALPLARAEVGSVCVCVMAVLARQRAPYATLYSSPLPCSGALCRRKCCSPRWR